MLNKEKEIINSYLSGESMNSLAKKYDTYATTVKRILEKNNIPLRHDDKGKGLLHVTEGEKLIDWAKSQKRLVTKDELAKVIGRRRLSPSYFIKYPELGQYVKTFDRGEFKDYTQQLYDWLIKNNISYKPGDRTKLKVAVTALLLGEYENIAIQIAEKPYGFSKRRHLLKLKDITERASNANINMIFINKEHFENLDCIKSLLDTFKNNRSK